jgi:hypothetical protein
VEVISTIEEVEIKLQTEFIGEEIRTIESKVDVEPLVVIQVEIIKL